MERNLKIATIIRAITNNGARVAMTEGSSAIFLDLLEHIPDLPIADRQFNAESRQLHYTYLTFNHSYIYDNNIMHSLFSRFDRILIQFTLQCRQNKPN